jgi:hypothetical protein
MLKFLSDDIKGNSPYFTDIGSKNVDCTADIFRLKPRKYCYNYEINRDDRRGFKEIAKVNHVTKQLLIFFKATEQFTEVSHK